MVAVAVSGFFGQLQARQAFEQHLQGDLHLDARQRRANAEMDSGAEGHVLLVGAPRTKLQRSLEGGRVGVGRTDQKADNITWLKHHALGKFYGLIRKTREHVQRRIDAQTFLDGCGRRGVVGEEAARVAALMQDRAHRVAGLVHRCLVPGIQQQNGGGNQLVLRKPVAAFVSGNQHAEQVVARVLPSFCRMVTDEVGEGCGRSVRLVGVCARGGVHVHAHHVVRPVDELRSRLLRKPHHLRNHGCWQRCREGGQEIRLATLLETVDQLVRKCLDTRPQPFDLT